MKQNIYIETTTLSQKEESIKDAFGGMQPSLKREQPNFNQLRHPFIAGVMKKGRGGRHLGRDGPPGRARSPGIHFKKEVLLESLSPLNTKININILIKLKFNYLQTLNFYNHEKANFNSLNGVVRHWYL
ncbi:MAG TPA: hypothetical protein VGK10_15605 [Prolixibacteraceae bacterium]|jgi:hypothetical protein